MIITPSPAPSTPEQLRAAAARNNAEWCAAVSRSGHFRDALWCSPHRTPPLYPDAVTLTPGATAAEVLAGVNTAAPGCSVKDSFAALDLAPAGFEVLFGAQWIHRPAGPGAPAGGRGGGGGGGGPGGVGAGGRAGGGGGSTGR
ncbi:hypothetical protein ACQKM2_17955, partial [Streptomyces sp. NPDC004126]